MYVLIYDEDEKDPIAVSKDINKLKEFARTEILLPIYGAIEPNEFEWEKQNESLLFQLDEDLLEIRPIQCLDDEDE